METIFEALRSDHSAQRELVAKLTSTTGASDDRAALFQELKAQLSAHAGAEERYFYNPLLEHDVSQTHARHSVAEHKEIDDFVEKLESTDMSSSQWLLSARELEDRLIHHLDEEELEIFPVAGKALADGSKAELARLYTEDMTRRLNEPRQPISESVEPSILASGTDDS